jgi:hypothetical protein
VTKKKRPNPPPAQHRKRFWTTRRLAVWGTLGGLTIAGLGLIATIIDPSIYQTYFAGKQSAATILKPDLNMNLRVGTLPQRDEGGTHVTLEVNVDNKGNKDAGYFYWHLMVPVEYIHTAEYNQRLNNKLLTPEAPHLPSGETFIHFQDMFDKRLPSGAIIGRLSLYIKKDATPFDVRWEITCCDTMIFPSVPDLPNPDINTPHLGSIRISPNSLKQWEYLETIQPPVENRIRRRG